MWGKFGEGEMEGDRGMVEEVEDANLSGGRDDGLGGGGVRWWICCRFLRVCGEL